MAFLDVITGHVAAASDLNQFADALNGSVASAIFLLAASSVTANNPLNALIPTVPAADCTVVESLVTGDANARAATYVRATGYGGFLAGLGGATSPSAHLYAQANGWHIPENLTIDGTLTVAGANVAVVGAHSVGQTIISYGNGAPGALAANEIYIQLT